MNQSGLTIWQVYVHSLNPLLIHSTNNLTPSYLLPQVADFEAAGGKDGLAEHVRRAFVDTIVHEILHALYFSDWLYDFFVDDASQPVKKEAVVETDSQERLAIKMPATVAKAKEHYSCTSLTSVPLENGGKSLIRDEA